MGCKKVERRTPYMKSWGDGRNAETMEEAERIWQEVKRMEKKEEETVRAEDETSPSTGIQSKISNMCSNFDLDCGTNGTLLIASAWAAGVGCGVLGFRYLQIHAASAKSAA